jgi:biotin carboxyl carrier protein
MTVTAIAPNLYRVDDGQRRWTVAVAGPTDSQWVWIDGQVARLEPRTVEPPNVGSQKSSPARQRSTRDDLTAPMPATVIRIAVDVGASVGRGDTLIILEAMKMELPIRAPRDGTVKAIHCATGELVQPGVNLIELE